MGIHDARKSLSKDFIRATPGLKVLGIGCGPAGILAYLPDVAHTDFEISGS